MFPEVLEEKGRAAAAATDSTPHSASSCFSLSSLSSFFTACLDITSALSVSDHGVFECHLGTDRSVPKNSSGLPYCLFDICECKKIFDVK